MEILVDIIKATPGVLIASAVTYYLSQRKYTFEKLYDRKLSYLEELYEKTVLLEKYQKKYVLTLGAMISEESLEDRKTALKPIQEMLLELQEFFWKKEIVLNQKTIDTVQSFIDVSIEILSNLEVSNISSQLGDNKSAYDQWKKAYEIMNQKLAFAKVAIKQDFKEVIEGSK